MRVNCYCCVRTCSLISYVLHAARGSTPPHWNGSHLIIESIPQHNLTLPTADQLQTDSWQERERQIDSQHWGDVNCKLESFGPLEIHSFTSGHRRNYR